MPRPSVAWGRLAGAVLLVALPNAGCERAVAEQPSASLTQRPDERHDLVGTRLPELRFDAWLGGVHAGGPTLYRWWTDTCSYCERSLPAIEALRTRFEPRGLRVVAVYHPKPPRDVAPEDIRGAADRLGYRGLISVDRDWSELSRFYLTTGDRPATSASFLVDGAGTIRFVHPGPELTPSDPEYAELERAIERLLSPAQ